MKKIIAIAASAIMGAAFMAGCSNESIVGTWASEEMEKSGSTITFKADNTFTLTTADFSLDGTYEAKDGKLTTTVMGMSNSGDYTLKGGKLTSKAGSKDGTPKSMKRVK